MSTLFSFDSADLLLPVWTPSVFPTSSPAAAGGGGATIPANLSSSIGAGGPPNVVVMNLDWFLMAAKKMDNPLDFSTLEGDHEGYLGDKNFEFSFPSAPLLLTRPPPPHPPSTDASMHSDEDGPSLSGYEEDFDWTEFDKSFIEGEDSICLGYSDEVDDSDYDAEGSSSSSSPSSYSSSAYPFPFGIEATDLYTPKSWRSQIFRAIEVKKEEQEVKKEEQEVKKEEELEVKKEKEEEEEQEVKEEEEEEQEENNTSTSTSCSDNHLYDPPPDEDGSEAVVFSFDNEEKGNLNEDRNEENGPLAYCGLTEQNEDYPSTVPKVEYGSDDGGITVHVKEEEVPNDVNAKEDDSKNSQSDGKLKRKKANKMSCSKESLRRDKVLTKKRRCGETSREEEKYQPEQEPIHAPFSQKIKEEERGGRASSRIKKMKTRPNPSPSLQTSPPVPPTASHRKANPSHSSNGSSPRNSPPICDQPYDEYDTVVDTHTHSLRDSSSDYQHRADFDEDYQCDDSQETFHSKDIDSQEQDIDYENDDTSHQEKEEEEEEDKNYSTPDSFKLRASKSPIIDALVFCALKNWGISLVNDNGTDIKFQVHDLEQYYTSSAKICAKQNPTEDESSRIKALKRWFPDFPTKRERHSIQEPFLITVARGTKGDNKPLKLHRIIENNRKLLGMKKVRKHK